MKLFKCNKDNNGFDSILCNQRDIRIIYKFESLHDKRFISDEQKENIVPNHETVTTAENKTPLAQIKVWP